MRTRGDEAGEDGVLATLTPREREVIALMAGGGRTTRSGSDSGIAVLPYRLPEARCVGAVLDRMGRRCRFVRIDVSEWIMVRT